MPLSRVAYDAIQPRVRDVRRRRRRGKRRTKAPRHRGRTNSTPSTACWGIIIHKDLLAMRVDGRGDLGADRRCQGEECSSGKDCDAHVAAMHRYGPSFAKRPRVPNATEPRLLACLRERKRLSYTWETQILGYNELLRR